MTRRRLICLYAFVLSTAVALSAFSAAPPAPAGFQLDGDAANGKTVYDKRCALCHGATGDGQGKMAASLNPKPLDFTSKALMAKRSDWEVYLAIRDGGKAVGLSPTMFGWKGLISDQEIRDVAAYVRSLAR